MKYNLSEKTVSMWTFISHFREQFMNPFYEPENQQQLNQIYITNYFDLKVWKELYFKYSEQNLYYKFPEIMSPDDHKDYIMKEQRKNNAILKILVDGS